MKILISPTKKLDFGGLISNPNCARSVPEKKAVLFQFEIVFVKTSKQFQIKIVFCKIRSQFSMNTIPISHFFSARFARKQFKLEISKSLSKNNFHFGIQFWVPSSPISP